MEDVGASASAAADSRLESDEYSVNTGEFSVDSAAAPENIAVCIRVRPLTEREERQRDVSVLHTVPKLQLISITDAQGAPLPGKTNVFQYDHIFDAPSSTVDMYARVARRIVRSTLEGINGTIFAYGQTSSGKTYTMQGPLAASSASDSTHHHQAMDLSASPGLLQLAVDDIFQYIKQCEDRDFLLRVSFVEIYNEVVRDLLSAADKDANLKLREDPRKGVYVECKEEIITDFESILHLLHAGNQRRAVGQTAMNERSSRSHSIFRIVIESKRKSSAVRKSATAAASSASSSTRRTSDEDVNGAVLVASLSLVDLAGSESLRHTAAEGIRQREAGNINKSLLTLSRVINSLASAGDPASQNAPFRDSKLTRLLQNSLGGNTRTLIVCCVTPAERYLEETKSTLQFAARAKSIQISATVNEVLDDQAQLRRLKREVHELKKLVHSERDQYKAEIDDHKVKIDHLKGLILSSASIASKAAADKERLLDGRQRARSKRSRETWCPGDFPSSFKTRRLDSFDESPLSLKRLSADSKRSRLSSDVEDFHENEARQNPGSARSSVESDAATQAHRLWIQLLTQSLLHPDANETAGLWESVANASGIENSDDVVKLQNELRAVVNACQASTQDENERLRMRIKELEGQSTNVDVAANAPVELTRQLEEANQSLAREQERYQALVEEKELSDEVMTTERDDLMQHLHTLQSTVAEKESHWEAEKQQLQTSLEEVLAEVDEFRSRISRTAGSDAASAVQELAKVKRQLKKSQMELARAREEQQRREELHREALADAEAASKGSTEEYVQQLEDAYAEIEELKLLKTQVVEQLEAAFDEKAKELTVQLEEAQEAARALEQELAARKATKEEAADKSPEFEQVLAEKQALVDAKAGLEEQLERMTTRQSRLEQQIKTMDEDNSELQENVEELQCRVDALLKEKQQMQERPAETPVTTGLEDVSGELKEVLNELVQLRATIDSTEREKEDLADQNERLAGELGDVKTLLIEKEHQVKVLHAQLDAKVMTISQLSGKHSAEVTALKQEAERLQMQQQDVSHAGADDGDTSVLKDKLIALTERNAQLEEMVAMVQQESQQVAAAKKQYQEAAATIMQEIQQIAAEKQDFEEETALIMRQLQQAAADRQQFEEEAATLKQLIQKAEAGVQQFKEKEEKEEAPSAAQYTGFKEESEADVLPTQAEAADSDEDWKAVVDSHNDADAGALIAPEDQARAQLEKLVGGLRGQLQLSAAKLPEDVEVAHAVAQFDEQRQEIEAAIASFQHVLAHSAAQRNELVEELRALEAQLMIESEEKMQLVVAADEQRVKLREAEDKLRQVEEKLAKSLALQQSTAEESDAATRRLEEELERTREALQAETTSPSKASAPADGDKELRRQLETQRQVRRTLELDVKSYEETLALLRHELTESSHATAELVEKLKAMEGELDAAARRQQSAEKEIKRLSTALERSDEEKVEMQRQMKQRLVAAETRELALEEKLELLERGGKTDSSVGEAALAARQMQAEESKRAKETIAGLEQQLEEARDTLATRERELEQKLDQLQELQERLDQAEIDERVLREQVAGLEARVREQEAVAARQLEEAGAQWEQQVRDRAKQAALEVDGLREQLQEAQEELEGYQKYADDEIHRLRTLNEQADAELAQLAATHEAREQALLKQVDEQEQWLAQLKHKQRELQKTCDELDAARRTLRETHEQDVAQLRAGGSEEVEKLRQEVTRSREELEELREALRASELEARHYHGQLVEAQLAQERAEERIETQRARIDKLEKVKMTNETLEVFRKLKSDRKALQEAVAKLQRQLQETKDKRAGGSQRANEAAARELERSREHLQELRDALRAEKQRGADMRAALRDEHEKSAGEVDAMRELLRGKVAAAEELAMRVEQLERAYATLQQQQQQQEDKHGGGNVSSLERENLELQFENRKLRDRLAGNQQDDEGEREAGGDADADKENELPVSNGDDKATELAVRHPALPPSVQDLRRQVDEKEQDARQQCAQQ